MKRALQITGILVGLLMIVGVLVYAFTPREKLLAYVVPEINNIRITEMYVKDQKGTMQVHFNATSKLIPVFIQNLTYDFRLYDESIIQGNQNFKPESKSGKVQRVMLPASINYQQVSGLIQRQVTAGSPLEAHFQASCHLPFIGHQRFNFTRNLSLNLPMLPVPKLSRITTQDFGFNHQRLVMTLAIDNPNRFDFYLRDLKMNVQINDFLASASSLPKDYLIKARQVTHLTIPSTSAIKRTQSFTENAPYPYQLAATLVIEPISEEIGEIRQEVVKTGIISIKAPN